MSMRPEEKAKRIARQEAEWAKQRGEVPESPPVSNEFVVEGCEQFTSVEYAMAPGEAEPIISVTADEVLADPKAFPPAVQRVAKEMKSEAKPKAAPKPKKGK